MITPYQPKERTSAAIKNGFDSDPAAKEVGTDEVLFVYRAHNGTGSGSKLIGRFFFTPKTCDTPSVNWTAEMLERELNASLWGNELRFLAKFQVMQGVKYKIGPIAHDKYQGVERVSSPSGELGKPFDQYSYFRNQNLFYQVEIAMTSDWRNYLKLLSDEPIKAGRFHRKSGNC